MNPVTYSIRDLATEFDVTPRSIRFYEDRGMLAPRRAGQQRVYDESQRVRLKLILRGKRMGFSLEECQQLIDLYDPQTGNQVQLQRLLEKIRERRAQLSQQMEDIHTTMQELDHAETSCLKALHKKHATTAPSFGD